MQMNAVPVCKRLSVLSFACCGPDTPSPDRPSNNQHRQGAKTRPAGIFISNIIMGFQLFSYYAMPCQIPLERKTSSGHPALLLLAVHTQRPLISCNAVSEDLIADLFPTARADSDFLIIVRNHIGGR